MKIMQLITDFCDGGSIFVLSELDFKNTQKSFDFFFVITEAGLMKVNKITFLFYFEFDVNFIESFFYNNVCVTARCQK